MSSIRYKVCPRCQQPAVMDMQVCQRCGHVYRSVGYQPTPVPAQPYALPRRRWWPFAVGALVFVAVIGLMFFLATRPVQSPLVGKWVHTMGVIAYVFRPDGSGESTEDFSTDHSSARTEPITWFTSGNILSITRTKSPQEPTLKLIWALSDDRSILSLTEIGQRPEDYRRAD